MEPYDLVSVSVRAAAFILSLQAAGLVFFAAACCHASPGSFAAVARRARIAAIIAAPIVLAHRLLDAPRLAGEWDGILDGRIEGIAWTHLPGLATIVCAAGLLAIAAGATTPSHRGWRVALAGALLVIGSFALTGHTTDPAVPAVLHALVVAHVGIAAYWVGSVAGLHRLAVSAPQADVVLAARRFSSGAVWLVPLLLPIGVGILAGVLHDIAALRSPYGALLLGKLLGFCAVLGLAAVNRMRVLPALSASSPRATRRFRGTLAAEYALLCIVLATTAVMSALFSPH